jgi:hypothetical protein
VELAPPATKTILANSAIDLEKSQSSMLPPEKEIVDYAQATSSSKATQMIIAIRSGLELAGEFRSTPHCKNINMMSSRMAKESMTLEVWLTS